MKRAVVAIFCCAALLANAAGAAADSASDQDMANRYLQAAKSGDDDAQFYLGALYSAGIGLPRSDEEAFGWFSRAADRGNSHAMLITSGLYAIGRGVERDYVKAYEYAYIVGSATKVDEFPQRLPPIDGRARDQDDGGSDQSGQERCEPMARRRKPEPGQGFRSRRQYARYPCFAAATDNLDRAACAASIKPTSCAGDLERATVVQGQQ